MAQITQNKTLQIKFYKKGLVTLSLISLLAACGGSSSDSSTPESDSPVSNTAPIANAGSDQSVAVSTTVSLSASGSSDADNDILSYQWQLSAVASGSSASLSSTTHVATDFVADVAGNYSAQLIVNDGTVDSIADTISITVTEQPSGATDITDINFTERSHSCSNYVGSYISNVEDIKRALAFSGSVTITEQNGECSFNVNEIPNHDFNDNSASFATNVSAQSGSYQVTATPAIAASVTELSLQMTNAVMLNGVLLDILPAACYGAGNESLGNERIGCGQDLIDHPWRYDPMSPFNGFGTDEHNAHTQPDGTYHYHANPMAMFEQDCDIITEQSPVIGFAADGFPIFGSCFDDNGTVKKAQSSYQLKAGVRQDVSGYTTPTVGNGGINSNNYDGQFRGDYEYVENSGDLDQCNGRMVDGQYGYFVTDTYPWVMACFKGSPNNSLLKGGANLINREHGHEHTF